MAIDPLPPGLIARLAIPPTYQTAALDAAPPAYIAPISSERPETMLLPPCPSPPTSASPRTSQSPTSSPPPTQQQQQQQQQPPEYSPSVYSQHLSYHLSTAAADFGFPSSPRRAPPSFAKSVELAPAHLEQQEPHLARFKESRTDLEMRVDLEGGADVDAERGGERRTGGFGQDLVGKRGVEERGSFWGRGRERRRLIGLVVGLLLVVVVLVVTVVVGICVGG